MDLQLAHRIQILLGPGHGVEPRVVVLAIGVNDVDDDVFRLDSGHDYSFLLIRGLVKSETFSEKSHPGNLEIQKKKYYMNQKSKKKRSPCRNGVNVSTGNFYFELLVEIRSLV